MKRRLLLLVPLLAALPALCIALRLGAGSKMLTADLPQIEPVAQRDFMRVSLIYDAGTRTLRGTQTLTATNRTDSTLSEAVLRLYMNGQSEGSVTVTNVTADGQDVSFEKDEDDSTVLRIALDWQPGQTVEFAWTLMLTHPKADGPAMITLPALAMLEDGVWRTDVYDELAGLSFAQAFDYTIDLIAHEDIKAAFGGALTSCRAETAVDEWLYHAQMQGARDVSLALLPGGKQRQKQVGGVLVTAVSASPSQASELLKRAQEALADLEKLGVVYPFPTLTVASCEGASQDGDVLSGLIALRPEGDKEQLRRQMTRLIGRQTFGVLVENDPWNAPWLSHSIASAVEMLCYRQRKGIEAYEARFFEEVEIATRVTRPYGVTVGAGTAFFGSDAEMTQVLRDQGAAMLLGVESAVGEEAFCTALQAYVQQNAGRTGTREALEAALLETTGSDWSGYFEDELSF